jgi:hypothetical protein
VILLVIIVMVKMAALAVAFVPKAPMTHSVHTRPGPGDFSRPRPDFSLLIPNCRVRSLGLLLVFDCKTTSLAVSHCLVPAVT